MDEVTCFSGLHVPRREIFGLLVRWTLKGPDYNKLLPITYCSILSSIPQEQIILDYLRPSLDPQAPATRTIWDRHYLPR